MPDRPLAQRPLVQVLRAAATRADGVECCLTTQMVAAVLRRAPQWVREHAVDLGGVRESGGSWRFTAAGVAEGLEALSSAPLPTPKRPTSRWIRARSSAPHIALTPKPR